VGILGGNINALTNTANDAKLQVVELKKSSETWKAEYMKLKDTSKVTESLVKAQAEKLETYRRASDRFIDDVKGLDERKGRSHSSSSSRKDASLNGVQPKKEKDTDSKS